MDARNILYIDSKFYELRANSLFPSHILSRTTFGTFSVVFPSVLSQNFAGLVFSAIESVWKNKIKWIWHRAFSSVRCTSQGIFSLKAFSCSSKISMWIISQFRLWHDTRLLHCVVHIVLHCWPTLSMMLTVSLNNAKRWMVSGFICNHINIPIRRPLIFFFFWILCLNFIECKL